MARILLGVCGGIAAYKALEFTRLATKAGHAVRVVQTEASTRLVGTASFAAITGAPVLVSEWEADPLRGSFPGDPLPEHAPISHLALVERADLFLIAPASANTIAKLAHGLADNLLTSAALACRRPLIVAPAMNDAMYEHPSTRANLAVLRDRGVEVLEPGVGALGSQGEWGVGRLPEPAQLLAACKARLGAGAGGYPGTTGDRKPHLGHSNDDRRWSGLRVLVTAGGTREPIDAVRFVGNRSSGRMGWALAEEAAGRGAGVTVIAANVSLPRHPGVEYVDVATTAELAAACAERFDACDVLLMAAAVADYAPASAHTGKIKKDEAGERLALELERTPDVISGLAAHRRAGQLLIGFAAEHGDDAVAYGRDKLARKGLDAVVVNDVAQPGIAFEAPDNEVTIVTAGGEQHVARASKATIAAAILDAVLSLRSASDVRVID
jgi:phosphopantothenoylcysteine decarboxylase/phosphopantothenate--cysteine ligase